MQAKPSNGVKKSRRISLKPNFINKRESNSSDCFHSSNKNKQKLGDIIQKFSNNFTGQDGKFAFDILIENKWNYIEGLWNREKIWDMYRLSTFDLKLPTFELDPSLMDLLMNWDSSEMFSKMKILGTMTNVEKWEFTLQSMIDSEAYKQKTKDSISQTHEVVWRFGYEDLRVESRKESIYKYDLLTRKEIFEIWVEHIKKIPEFHPPKSNSKCRDEEEKRLYSDEIDHFKGKSEMHLFSEYIKVFPIFKRTDNNLDIKFVYLIPNIEFEICAIKSIHFGNSKLLSILEHKYANDEGLNFEEISYRSGFLSYDSKGKFHPYLRKDIKRNPICGLWIYNDTIEIEGKSKQQTKHLIEKSWLNHQVWTYLLSFSTSQKYKYSFWYN